MAARAAGGEVLVTRPVVELAGPHLEFERIGEVRLKGFGDATELFVARRGGRRWLTTCSSASGPPACSPPGPTSSCCCRAGATRSACSTSPSRWAAAVRALHVNYGLREEAGEDEAHCRALCEPLGVALAVHARHAARRRPRQPAGVGTRRALRGGDASAAARRSRGGRPHRLRPGRDRPLPPGGLARPARAARHARRARATSCARCLAVTREETGAWCRARGLAWRDDATNEADGLRARACGGLFAALGGRPARRGQRRAHRRAAARGGGRARRRRRHGARRPRAHRPCPYLADLPPALARLIVRRLAEAATGGLCARAATRLADILALGETGRWTSATARGRWSRAACCASRGRRRFSGLRSRSVFRGASCRIEAVSVGAGLRGRPTRTSPF